MWQRFNRLRALVLGSGALRQSAIAASGNVITGLISAVAIILASRLLGPTEFGVFSVATSLIAIGSKLGDVGLNAVITRFLPRWQGDRTKARQLLRHIIFWKTILAGIGLGLVLLCQQPLSDLLNYHHPTMWFWVAFGSLVLILFEHTLIVAAALHEFVWASVVNITQALFKVISFVWLGICGVYSTGWLTFIYALAPVTGVLLVLRRFQPWLLVKPAYLGQRWQKMIQRYAGHAAVGVTATTLIANIDLLFVQKYLSPLDTGVYAGASRIALFVAFVAAAVGTVLNNRVARYQARETQALYLKKSLVVVLIAILGFLCFLPLARLALVLTIGPEYLPGLPALIVLVANAFLGLAVVPYISFFYALDIPYYFSLGGILQMVVIGLVSWWGLPQYGLMAAAYARLLATVVFVVYTTGMIWFTWGNRQSVEH